MKNKIEEAEKWYDTNKKLYELFSSDMEEIITKILQTKNIPYQSVSNRVKEKESYLNKCASDKYTNPVEEIMDVSGIRIIAYTNRDVKRICKVLQEEFVIDQKNSVNKADLLKTNKVGYISIHYVMQLNEDRVKLAEYNAYKNLRSEVQVRTLLQHTWAEIEHDRNYKFAGRLPDEIKRRFYLVAGVLELMDGEFDKLSSDIDEYEKSTKEAVAVGNYDLQIDSKSLEHYMLARFENLDNLYKTPNATQISEEVVEELLGFGYKTIKDIEDGIKKHVDIFEEKRKNTFIGMLRNVMILEDCNKYFTKAYKGDWQVMRKSSVEFYKENGINDIEEYLNQNEISIE